MERLARVFFDVQAGDAKLLRAPVRRVSRLVAVRRRYFDPAVLGKWAVVLRDLIAFGKVWIKVVLARKNRLLIDVQVQRQSGAGSHLDDSPIEDRQRARQP